MTDHLSRLRQDYAGAEISPRSLDEDPIEQFRHWFADAERADIYEPNAMSLTTVDDVGHPSSRMVLLKQLTSAGFTFFTDYNSRKGKEIDDGAHVALLFWWDRIHRQVRIEGRASRVSTDVSDAYFAERPWGSQISAIVSPQSQVLSDRTALENAAEELSARLRASGESPARPPHWGGYCVTPQRMEFWQGRTNRMHDRVVYERRDSVWTKRRLAP